MKYTITQLHKDFPDEGACLRWLVNWLYPDGIMCKICKQTTTYHPMKTRKSYSCEVCGRHIHPTAGTIFHKSSTPLTLWIYAIYLMASTRSGISAKQLERELGVTYKTAWRMFHQIRKLMADSSKMLSGEVEVDEMYISPDPSKNTRRRKEPGKRYYNSEVVFGMVARGGKAKVKHVISSGERILTPEIKRGVKPGTIIYSDEARVYSKLDLHGYPHASINHSHGIYVNGNIHTQNVENLWSNIKRGIRGVYRHVDVRYLQAYIDEYAFRYSHRNSPNMFWALMSQIKN